jgi:hypothetical protein
LSFEEASDFEPEASDFEEEGSENTEAPAAAAAAAGEGGQGPQQAGGETPGLRLQEDGAYIQSLYGEDLVSGLLLWGTCNQAVCADCLS